MLLELALLLGALALGWVAWRRGAVRNAASFASALLAGGVGVGAGYLLALGVRGLGGQISTAALAALIACAGTYAGLGVLLRRRLQRGDPSPLDRWEARWDQRRSLRLATAVVASLGALVLALSGAFVAVNLVALRWPRLVRGGVVLELLQLRDPGPPGARGGDPDALERVARRIGLRQVLDHYEALRVVLTLPSDRLRWLVARDPQLERIMEHPLLRELAGDAAFSQRLLSASEGSPSAVAALLDSERLDSLREDEALRRALGRIDLVRLRQRVERRAQLGFPLPLRWREVAHGALPTSRLTPWSRYRLGPLVELDPRATSLAARSAWVSEAGGPHHLRLRAPDLDGHARAWLDGKPLELSLHGDWWVASWVDRPGQPRTLELALEPGASLAGRLEAWAVEVIPPPSRDRRVSARAAPE